MTRAFRELFVEINAGTRTAGLEVQVVKVLPTTASGKLLRNKLAEIVAEGR